MALSPNYMVLTNSPLNGEPSHTFALVDASGNVVWFKDYGAPDNPDRTMYVETGELVSFIEEALK